MPDDLSHLVYVLKADEDALFAIGGDVFVRLAAAGTSRKRKLVLSAPRSVAIVRVRDRSPKITQDMLDRLQAGQPVPSQRPHSAAEDLQRAERLARRPRRED